jgi:hypothetical protein
VWLNPQSSTVGHNLNNVYCCNSAPSTPNTCPQVSRLPTQGLPRCRCCQAPELDPSSQLQLQCLGNSVRSIKPFERQLISARRPRIYTHTCSRQHTSVSHTQATPWSAWPSHSQTLEAGVVCCGHNTPAHKTPNNSLALMAEAVPRPCRTEALEKLPSMTLPASRRPRQQPRQPCQQQVDVHTLATPGFLSDQMIIQMVPSCAVEEAPQ